MLISEQLDHLPLRLPSQCLLVAVHAQLLFLVLLPFWSVYQRQSRLVPVCISAA